MPEMEFLLWEDAKEIQGTYLSAVMFFPHRDEGEVRKNWIMMNLLKLAGALWVARQEEAEKRRALLNLSLAIGTDFSRHLVRLGGWAGLCNAVIGSGQNLPPGEQAKRRREGGVIAALLLKESFRTGGKRGIGALVPDFKKNDLDKINSLLPDGQNINASNEEYIKWTLWPKFRSVAHLWCAWLIPADTNQTPEFYSEGPLHSLPFEKYPGGIKLFLAVAEHIRRAAEALPKKPGPKPHPDEAWRVPKGYELPDYNAIWPPDFFNSKVT